VDGGKTGAQAAHEGGTDLLIGVVRGAVRPAPGEVCASARARGPTGIGGGCGLDGAQFLGAARRPLTIRHAQAAIGGPWTIESIGTDTPTFGASLAFGSNDSMHIVSPRLRDSRWDVRYTHLVCDH
jgi:hypothetical protein